MREPNFSDDKTANKDMAMLFLDHRMTADKVEEVVLYDLSNIVATLGGSLSLFLGVSAFSVILFLWERMRRLSHPKRSSRILREPVIRGGRIKRTFASCLPSLTASPSTVSLGFNEEATPGKVRGPILVL